MNESPLVLNIQPKPSTPVGVPYQSAEVSGIVTRVDYGQRRGDPTRFKIHCPNMGKTFDAVCELFCPIRQGDTIYALCRIGLDSVLHVARPPFVQPAIDRDTMIQCFMRALKQGFGPAVKFYSTISKIAQGDENVIPFLTGIAQSWNDTHNCDILFMFHGIEHEDVKKLLGWWHRERNLRRLYLFGLTKKEINACRMTCDEIYQRCMVNPYTVPAIPLEKCDMILDQLNKTSDMNDKIRGSIVRMIWKRLNESGWTGVSTRILAKQFPDIKAHIEILRSDYDVVAEMELAYLKFPHKVEVWIAEFIINKCREDLIDYSTPIDEYVTKGEKTIKRMSAHFTRELAEDQQKAVQGALDHGLCIVTGPGGTGKCVAKGTPILMFDGNIKKIESIKVGEYVMGPDSLPRRVLSKCLGVDDMFEIVPNKGKSFVCNTPHVITLKGFVPFLGFRTDRAKGHIAIYSVRGCQKRKAFLTKEEAQIFIDSLQEDIFDIPLNEYMTRSYEHKRYSYLFHVGITFPEQQVPMDPYMIGYWLGDGKSSCAAITTADPEIVQVYTERLANYQLELSPVGPSDPITYRIVGSGDNYRRPYANQFSCALRDLDMLDNKHIPNVYKINSRQVRLQLLAGLVDSDGYAAQGYIEIIQKNTRLADDIEYLAFSLGFMITRVECEKGCMYKGEMRNGIYQRMNIFGEGLEEIPVILPRKQSAPRKIDKRATCLSFEVVPRGRGIYCGFELDGDGRFLLGDFLVTHNTTVLGQVVHNLELRGINYAVCSFTGKAVARIREVTKKRNPATMHRLISNTRKSQMDRKSNQFEKDIPLSEYEHVIIDEASMVTTELLYDFLQAYPNIQKLTLIGDVNQLSPIGWGSLFQQMLLSETIPTYRLTTNYRVYISEGERDGIILNANMIVAHDPLYPFEFITTSNFSIIDGPIERVYDIIKGCYTSGIRAEQLVIISPYNRPLDSLNRTFQTIYNDGSRSATDSRGTKWAIGDRVMLTENDADTGIFNGESGTIRDITSQAILVDFGSSGCHEFLLEPTQERAYYDQGTTHSYGRRGQQMDSVLDGDEGDLDDERTVKRLKHSYAISIDKSQGSEWDFVIVYIDEFNVGSFINRNRIYTGITRAKRCCWMVVSDIDSLNTAAVKPSPKRCENLAKRISAQLPNLKPFKIASPIPALEMNGDMPILPEDIIPQDAIDTGFDFDDFD
jgi:hypothetical protein